MLTALMSSLDPTDKEEMFAGLKTDFSFLRQSHCVALDSLTHRDPPVSVF